MGSAAIRTDDTDAVVAGGVESTSMVQPVLNTKNMQDC